MNKPELPQSICFVGAGSMAEAIIRRLTDTRLVAPERIFAVNHSNIERLEELSGKYGIAIPRTETEKERMIADAGIVILAMKPKDAPAAITALAPLLRAEQLIISVIAGYSLSSIAGLIGRPSSITRTMPNTSSMIGLGATGMSFSEQVTGKQRQLAQAIFESIGIVKIVDEYLLDAVTGLSGSGPAYIYYVLEAMIQGGVESGLTHETARDLAVQTVLGAAHMLHETGEEPSELRRKVTSPGGTTEAAIELMSSYRLQEAVLKGVLRATERAKELGSILKKID